MSPRRILSIFVLLGTLCALLLWLWPLVMLPVAARVALRVVALLYLLSVAWVLYYRFRNPAVTYYMHRQRRRQAILYDAHIDGFVQQWVGYDAISDEIKLAAIAAEDVYFAFHWGFDWESMRHAHEYNKSAPELKRGASTITQQMVKNLFLWPGPYLSRKVLEAYLTLLVEALWSKRRILEVYLNVAQFSPAIFGVEAAARYAFGVDAGSVDRKQAAQLITVLPNPILMPVKPPTPAMRMRQVFILESMRRLGMDYLEWI